MAFLLLIASGVIDTSKNSGNGVARKQDIKPYELQPVSVPDAALRAATATTPDTNTASTNVQAPVLAVVDRQVKMVRVIDGDTIVVQIRGVEEKVRLIGIDTPERGKPYYSEATEKTRELLGAGELRLAKDVRERDKYGRLLRYVYVGEVFINAELVRQGYAMPLTYPPDVAHAEEFRALAEDARNNERGLWGAQ